MPRCHGRVPQPSPASWLRIGFHKDQAPAYTFLRRSNRRAPSTLAWAKRRPGGAPRAAQSSTGEFLATHGRWISTADSRSASWPRAVLGFPITTRTIRSLRAERLARTCPDGHHARSRSGWGWRPPIGRASSSCMASPTCHSNRSRIIRDLRALVWPSEDLLREGKVGVGSAHIKGVVSGVSFATPDVPPPEMLDTKVAFARPSFESVYRAHGRTVARWAIRLLGPKADFEDIVQDVFMVVRRRLPEFRGEAEITTWLYEITVRVVQRWRLRARWWSWVTGRGQSPRPRAGAGARVDCPHGRIAERSSCVARSSRTHAPLLPIAGRAQ